MSEYAHAAERDAHHARSPISVPWVIGAALLCGVGLTLLWWFIEVFQVTWLLGGIALVFLGCLMFLNPRAGWDHA